MSKYKDIVEGFYGFDAKKDLEPLTLIMNHKIFFSVRINENTLKILKNKN